MTNAELETKVRALLALAGSSNPHEAALAAQRAAALAAKFRLDLSRIADAQEDVIEFGVVYRTPRKPEPWALLLADAIGTIYPSKMFFGAGRGGAIYAAARRSILPAIRETFIGASVAMEMDLSDARSRGRIFGRLEHGDFRHGWASAYQEVLRLERDKAAAEARKGGEAQEMALVLVSDRDAAARAFASKYPQAATEEIPGRRLSRATLDGWAAGSRAARSAHDGSRQKIGGSK